MTNLLFIGDIFASPGRSIVARYLKEIVASEKIDLSIANAENSAGGFGITPQLADELFGYGLDVLTSGNHIWDKREIYDYFARQPRLLRPANYVSELPGAYKNAASMRRQIAKFGLAEVVDQIDPIGNIMAGDWQRDAPWRKKRGPAVEAPPDS